MLRFVYRLQFVECRQGAVNHHVGIGIREDAARTSVTSRGPITRDEPKACPTLSLRFDIGSSILSADAVV
jgi:hypothetical protein